MLQAAELEQVVVRFGRIDALHVVLLFAGLVWVIWGVTVHEYYIPGIAAQFFAVGLAIGLVSVLGRLEGMSMNTMAESFRQGAIGLLLAALVVGVDKELELLMSGTDPQTASVMNTVLFTLAGVVGDVSQVAVSLADVWGSQRAQLLCSLGLRTGCADHADHCAAR